VSRPDGGPDASADAGVDADGSDATTDDRDDPARSRADGEPAVGDTGADDADDGIDVAALYRYGTYAALVALGLLAAFAGLQVYLDLSTVISQWVAPEYRRAVRAGFNLAVLLGALAAIYGLLERVRGADGGRTRDDD
jgi:hypothetical protein